MALDPITTALEIGGKVIDRLWPDPAQRDAAKFELFKLQQTGELTTITGQLDINKVEAGSASVFVAGWRPAVGWTCAAGLAIQFVVAPMCTWGASLLGHPITFPALDTDTLMTLLAGLLGLGSLRTFEKVKGAA